MNDGHWTVDVHISERGDIETRARAVLVTGDRTAIRGSGIALRSRGDRPVHEIGDELAAARALIDLGNRLLELAEAEVRDSTGADPVAPERAGGWELP